MGKGPWFRMILQYHTFSMIYFYSIDPPKKTHTSTVMMTSLGGAG